MINDSIFLNSVSQWHRQHQEDLFVTPEMETIAGWCIDHYSEEKEAPGIQVIMARYYEPWEEEQQGNERATLVADLLPEVQTAYEASSLRRNQLFNLGEDVLRRQQVLIATQRVGGTSPARDITEVVPGASPVSLAREPEYDNFFDDPNIARDVETSTKPVFTFDDEVVTGFFDDSLAPATFTTFIAPEKRGKSQWLMECSMAAMKCKKRVLYFDAGDMVEEQIFMRFAARAKKRPYRAGTQFIWNDLYASDGMVQYEMEEREWEDHITQKQYDVIKKKYAQLCKGRFFSRNFPRGTLSVETIRTVLDSLSMRGVVIDVLIIDYADILRPQKSRYSDNRHAVTEIWGDLRTLSMSYNLALITATQSDASAYNGEMTQSSFSESKTKNAFITAEIALEKTDIHESIFKLKYLFRRTGSLSRGIYVASDLATYRPVMKAIWEPKAETEHRVHGKFKNRK